MIEHNIKFDTTTSQFLADRSRIRHIMGPWGSGKSVACVTDIVCKASQQKRGPDGFRRSKWLVVRNTAEQLRTTSLRTWFDWFPDGSIGYYRTTARTYFIEVDDIRAEVMFRALEDAADVRNLLSLEITGAYFNEVREIAREILEGVDGRIGRYPSQAFGGPSWSGWWADTNPPEEGSYLEAMYEGRDPDDALLQKPNSWSVYKQPPAVMKDENGKWVLNPKAENIRWLPPEYYAGMMKDKGEEYIRVNLGSEYGRSKGGKPVQEGFNKAMHVANGVLVPDPASLLVISADFGGTPAIALKQQNALGQVVTLDEIVTFGSNLQEAIEDKLLPLMRNKYSDYEAFVTGDPSGDNSSQTNGENCTDIFRRYTRKGLGRVKFAYSNNPVLRQGATAHFLSRLVSGGKPAYLIDPRCRWLIDGLNGKYMRKKHKDGRHMPEVEKNNWSHICEASEYGDMYFERGGRRKAEQVQRGIVVQRAKQNAYNTPR